MGAHPLSLTRMTEDSKQKPIDKRLVRLEKMSERFALDLLASHIRLSQRIREIKKEAQWFEVSPKDCKAMIDNELAKHRIGPGNHSNETAHIKYYKDLFKYYGNKEMDALRELIEPVMAQIFRL